MYQPRPQEELDRLAAIVQNAVGFNTERNDQIEMVNMPFDRDQIADRAAAARCHVPARILLWTSPRKSAWCCWRCWPCCTSNGRPGSCSNRSADPASGAAPRPTYAGATGIEGVAR